MMNNLATIGNIGEMRVKKRGNRGYEEVKFDKITERINVLIREGGYGKTVNSTIIAQATIKSLYDGISTEELDYIAASISESKRLLHPHYSDLAGRIMISNLHKTTAGKFSDCMLELQKQLKIMDPAKVSFIGQNAAEIDRLIVNSRDYYFGYIAYKTLEKQYLHTVKEKEIDINGNVVYVDFDGNISTDTTVQRKPKYRRRIFDRPQYMFMRVAIEVILGSPTRQREYDATGKYGSQITPGEISELQEYYNALSEMRFIYATPTNFNACTQFAQLNSCFLLNTEDSIEEIMRTVTNAALISKRAGGIGIAYHKIRCRGADIKGTNGESSGICTQLKIYNEDARCWNQGGGKRLGAFAIYLEPWHGDIMAFLRLKLTQGADTERARDLFYALWTCDLFVLRSRDDTPWSLFSDDTAPGLSEVYDGMEVCCDCGYCENTDYLSLVGRNVIKPSDVQSQRIDLNMMVHCEHCWHTVDVFTNLYTRYEREGRAVRRVLPSAIIDAMCEAQRDQGVPYVSNKDHVNRQSNHKNLGTIQSSNLCNEIVQWHSKDEYACCSLASVNLSSYVRKNTEGVKSSEEILKLVDFDRLHHYTKMIVRGLDRFVSTNKYPVEECSRNAHKFRPIGIGVQGLANVFMKLRIPFLSPEAERVDLEIMETIYHAALEASCELADELGTYHHFEGSPYSNGILRMDLWAKNQHRLQRHADNRLIETMSKYGFSLREDVTHNRCGAASTDVSFRGAKLLSGRYDWDLMRARVSRGIRNSLLIALMPTVTTSILLGNNESFEPIPSNIYTKSTLAGKWTESNNLMVEHLIELGIWNDLMKNKIIANDGSLTGVEGVPEDVAAIYAPVWEMKQTSIMRRVAMRHVFVDQSQSINIHLADNSNAYLRGVFHIGWELGNCTGSYYIRTRPATDPLKNNIAELKAAKNETATKTDGPVCTREAGCDSCGS